MEYETLEPRMKVDVRSVIAAWVIYFVMILGTAFLVVAEFLIG